MRLVTLSRLVPKRWDSTVASTVKTTMGAVFPEKAGELGGHLFIVEFEKGASDIGAFAAAIDARLKVRNDDYRAHRAEGFGMHAPAVRVVPHGTFAAWMKSRGRLGGQNKVPRVINDAQLFANLDAFTAKGHD